jgi:hypothetical protein
MKKENYQIQSETIRLCVRLMKYAKENDREEILNFVYKTYFESNNFYNRRLYLTFVEECFEVFSICYLKEKGVISYMIKFLKNPNDKFLIGKTLEFLKICFPLINKDDKLVFLIFNKIQNLRKTNDSEIIKVNFIIFTSY